MSKNNIKVKHVNSDNFKYACELNKLGFTDMDLTQIVGYPFFKYDNLLLLFDENNVASSTCCINNQKLQMGDIHLDLGVIGAVTTHPEKRGMGFGPILMKESINIMREEGYDLTLVFPWSIPWYQRFGYNQILTNHKQVTTSDFLKQNHEMDLFSDNTYEIREFNYDTDNKTLEELHVLNNIGKFSIIERGINWALCQEKKSIYVACKNNKVVAFAVANKLVREYGKDPYGFKLREGACVTGEEPALRSLIKELCQISENEGFSYLVYDDVYPNLDLPGYNIIPSEKLVDNEYFDLQIIKMYKILNNKSVLRKLSPVWNQRIGNDICWQDILTIDYSENELNGQYKLNFTKSGTSLILNEQEYLEVLILGITSWSKFSDKKGIELSSWENEKMNSLFPKNSTVFWDIDFF